MQDGMRAMSQEEIAKRQAETAHLAQNAWPQSSADWVSMQNAYNQQAREMLENVGNQMPKPTLWQRFKWWLSDVLP